MADVEMADESIVELHPSWDVALIVAHNNTQKKFLVSSHILRVASKSFDSLLTSKFEEGAKTQPDSKPDIILHHDNPDAMEIILSILHYKHQDEWYNLSAKMIAVMAIHLDKYDCSASLRLWVNHWLVNFGQVEHGDVGYLLAATAYLGESAKFQKMTRSAILYLPMNFDFNAWYEDDMVSALPDNVIRNIVRKTKSVKQRLYALLQGTIIDLGRNQSEIGLMDTSRCSKCLRTYKRTQNTRCPNCPPTSGQQSEVCDFPVVCSPETRVAECTLMFLKQQLYPNEKAWRESTIADIARRFNKIREMNTHRCDFDQRCPLKKRLGELDEAVVEVIDGIRGWKLKLSTTDDDAVKSDGVDEPSKSLTCESK
ncbi:hypothetical protein CTAM01_01605 [Colletotrichum tamarilloi]|uniref:BTB domain-containing protein n=1 Tax=Colletotrichum tamarilloi TaxID=1209934 RepID=A0ABQ9RSA7_9PEZI|nr:uncharacterized protein CTAM01_01605 [Colletotrichum tamarilloi]KAK1511032.1 hypothetical protein CTAM01_01605 [Colletotrichum tamarilloi]